MSGAGGAAARVRAWTPPPRPRRTGSESDRRGDEDAAVGVVEGLLGDEFVHGVGGAPLVGDLGLGEVVDVGVPGVLVQALQLGGVLDGVAVRVEEVRERVVARHVAGRGPDVREYGPGGPLRALCVRARAGPLRG